MVLDWLRSTFWIYSGADLLWLVGFWGLFAGVALLEAFLPAVLHSAERSQRWPTNIGLGLVQAAISSLLPLSVLAAAEWAQNTNTGLLNSVNLPWWIAALVTLAIYSLGNFGVHVLMHTVPALWRVHRVHHLDTHLDVSTALRHHPVEMVVGYCVMIPVITIFGLTPSVLVAYAVTEGLFGALSHANLQLPDFLDRRLRWLLVTPNMHCIHHSSHQPETDSNYGQVLSLWDRLFGTYNAGSSTTEFGLTEVRDGRAASFWWQIKSPLLEFDEADAEASCCREVKLDGPVRQSHG